MYKFLIIGAILLFSFACNSTSTSKINSEKFETRTFDHLMDLDDQIVFSDELSKKKLTLIHLVNLDCAKCLAELKLWEKWLAELESTASFNPIFIGMGHSDELAKYYIIDELKFLYPVFFDVDSLVIKENPNVNSSYNNTILVNESKKILFIGSSPILSSKNEIILQELLEI